MGKKVLERKKGAEAGASESSSEFRRRRKRKRDADVLAEDAAVPQIEALQAYNSVRAAWPKDFDGVFAPDGIIDQAKRQELFNRAVSDSMSICDTYAWAIPDERALRVLAHFAPIVEIGAGAGYWAYCMAKRDIQCTAFDRYPPLDTMNQPRKLWASVQHGGPKVLKRKAHAHDTLFLCYPDDFEKSKSSMAARCLRHLQSDWVIHAGELFGDSISIDHAPWGRTSCQSFQEHLFSAFRCVLKVPLPSWPQSNDHLTVWRRVETCFVALEDESDEASGSKDGASESASEGQDADSEQSDQGAEYVCDAQYYKMVHATEDGATSIASLRHLL